MSTLQSNPPEDILDGVEPAGQPTSRPGEYPGRPATNPTPPPSLEQVIAQKKAGVSFKAAPPAGVPVPPPPTPPTAAPTDILSEVEVAETKVRRPAEGLEPGREAVGQATPAIPTGEESPLAETESPETATGPIVHQPPLLKNSKLFIIIAVVFGLGILGGGGWLVYHQFLGPSVAGPGLPATPPSTTSQPREAGATTEPQPDADLDGLPDAEEELYGTNPNAVDSDNDALTDRDEVKIFKTDPNEPDSDGDGYKDGEEVRAGYDPKGTGRLFRTTP